ncbi:MAG: T9SS type A sorting domain-containing protein [Bacteroidetes bacterium]|jgi:hypothetical protein|nr:T9SS type A sorting domain-containing protein [Bacteroidota bacterium]
MKQLILVMMILCSALITNAQFTENWNVRYQATGTQNFSNEGRKVAVDAMGNTFVLGDFSSDRDSVGNMLSGGATQYTVRLQKYNYLGTLIYWRTFIVNGLLALGGGENVGSFGLELDASNNVYIGYNYVNSLGNRDVVFKKFNNTLTTEIWNSIYATPANDYGVDMKVSASGQITSLVKIISGTNTTYALVHATNFSSTAVSFYNFIMNSEVINSLAITSREVFVTGYTVTSGVKSILVASISSAGSLIWKQNFDNNTPTSGNDIGNHIMIGLNGMVYVAGTVYTNATNGFDAIAILYSTTGARRGLQTVHIGTDDTGWRIANGPVGYVYLVSSTASAVTVSKLNSSNLTPNTKAIYTPTPITDYLAVTGISVADIKVSSSGNAYVAGTVTCSSQAGTYGASFLSKFGLNGVVFKNIGNMDVSGNFTSSYKTEAIAINPLRTDVVLLKNVANTYTSHAIEKMCLNSQDVSLPFRLADETQQPIASNVTLSPNPAISNVTISCQQPVSTVVLYDMLGKQAMIQSADGQNSINLALSNLNNGIYICKVIFKDGQSESRRLVVQ